MREFVATLFALAAGIACAQPANDGANRRELYSGFVAAREARDYSRADAILSQLLEARPYSNWNDDFANYLIFDRARCNVDFLPSDQRQTYLAHHHPQSMGALVCAAAKVPPSDESQVQARMAEVLDQRASSFSYRAGLYDEFARQATINLRALELLERFHLDDPRFDRDGESALIEQIRAGRSDNVRALLDRGYDANVGVARDWPTGAHADNYKRLPFMPLPILPLQAARESLATRGERALEVASVLLDHGANPNRLKWYPYKGGDAAGAEPGAQKRMDRLLADAAKTREQITAEFRGLLIEYVDSKSVGYARFLIGNGSSAPVAIQAWENEGLYLMNDLNSSSHLEFRVLGGTKWQSAINIEDGWSPSTSVEIAPGQSHEVLMSVGIWDLAMTTEGTRYRLWLNNYPGEIHSEPFDIHSRAFPIQTRAIEAERDWFGIKAR